jgi:hypothetical protein
MRLSGNSRHWELGYCGIMEMPAVNIRSYSQILPKAPFTSEDDRVVLNRNSHLLIGASFFDTLPFQETSGNNCCRRQTGSDAI